MKYKKIAKLQLNFISCILSALRGNMQTRRKKKQSLEHLKPTVKSVAHDKITWNLKA